MKTKIKRHSRSVISVILAVCMLVSCMTVGIIATDAAKVQSETVGANVDEDSSVGASYTGTTQTAVIYFTPKADWITAGYTIRANVKREGDNNYTDNQWAYFIASDTGKTISGNPIYSATITTWYSGLNTLQIQAYDGSTWKAQYEPRSNSWLAESNYKGKYYNSTDGSGSWVDYQYDCTITYTIGDNVSKGSPFTGATDNNSELKTGTITALSGTSPALNVTYAMFYDYDNSNSSLDGATATNSNRTFTFSEISADKTISIAAAFKPYTITINAGDNGSIESTSPSSLVDLTGAQTISVTVSPSTGYHPVWPSGISGVGNTGTFTTTSATNKTYTISFVKDQYTITANPAENGTFSLTPSTSPNDWGTSITVTDIQPNAHYVLDTVSYTHGGNTFTLTYPYTFELPKANTTVTVTFKEILHTDVSVAAKGSSDGTTFDTTLSIPATSLYINASGTTSATVGEVTPVSITAPETFTSGSDTYSFYQWVVSNATLGSAASIRANTITASANNATATAQYKKNYTVTATTGEHGSVTSTASFTVPAGGNATFTFTPDENYCVSAIKLNGGDNVLPAGSLVAYTYTTPAITADTTVTAEFYPTVTATATVSTYRRDGTTPRVGAGTGTVKVNSQAADASTSTDTVAKNATVTFTAAADSGSAFCGWYNNATSTKLLSTNPVLTTTVDSNTTVYAVFTKANFYLTGKFYQAHLAKERTPSYSDTTYPFTKDSSDPSLYTYNDDFMFAYYESGSQWHLQFVTVGFGTTSVFSTPDGNDGTGVSATSLSTAEDCYKWTCGSKTAGEDLNNCYKNVTFTWDAIDESLSWTTKDVNLDDYVTMFVDCGDRIYDHIWIKNGDVLTDSDIVVPGTPYISVGDPATTYNYILVKNSAVGNGELNCQFSKGTTEYTNNIEGMYAGNSYKINVTDSSGVVSDKHYYPADIYPDGAPTYYLTGAYSNNTAGKIFGTAWDPDAVPLVYNSANGKYEKSFSSLTSADKGTILFKVNKNGDMTTSWPAKNQSVRVKSYTTDITFSFNPGTHEITVTQSPEGGSWLYSGTAAADRTAVDVTSGWSAFTASESTTYGKTKFMYGTTDTGLSNALAPSHIYGGGSSDSSVGYFADITSTITHGSNYFFGLCAYGNQGNLIGNNSEQINHTTKSAGTTVEILDSNNNVLFKIQPKQNNDVSNSAHYMLVFDIDWEKVDSIGVRAWDHTKSTNGNAGHGSYVDYQFYYKPKLEDDTSDETAATEVKKVDIFAKNGTLRDDTFNRFTKLANTEIQDYFYYEEVNSSTGVTTTYETISAYNAAHASKIVISHEQSYGGSNYDKIVNVPVGAKIKLRTYLSGNDSNSLNIQSGVSFADTHYLKAYSINGMTYAVHTPTEATTVAESQTIADAYSPQAGDQYYEEIWTVRDVNTTYIKDNGTIDNATVGGKTIEVTPIYYMKDNSNCKTFYIDGYDGTVHNAWGNMLAVYPYYEGKNNKDNAFGGYPGQPMLFWGGKYQMEIPLTVDGTSSGATVKGLTLHNGYWDLFHRNEVDLRCKTRNHAQTYDYDDFYKLYKEKNPDTIIFDFKYRTQEDHYGDDYDYTKYNFARYNNPSTAEPAKGASDFVSGNGVELVTDYFGRQVDAFGNLITDANRSTYATTGTQTKELLFVSTGYKDTYVGEYATLWAVYAPQTDMDETTAKAEPGKFIGYISSSMLYLNNWDRRLQYTEGSSTANGRMSWTEFENTYKHLKNNYTGVPALISYEKELWNNSKDKAYRSDGKWYYSNKSDKVRSNIKIQYGAEILLNSPDKSILSEAWTDDDFDSTKIGVGGVNNIGTKTGCSAYFTNTSPNLNGKVDSGEQFADSKKNFTFQAVASGSYMFAYWVRYSNGKYYQVSEEEVAQSPMSSNDTYIARFVEARTGSLTIQHVVENTNTFNGTGTPSLTVLVKDGETVVNTDSNSPVTDGSKIDISKWINSNFNDYTINISLTTTPTSENESFMKEIVSSSATHAPASATWNSEYTSTYSIGADTAAKSVTIAQFTVADVLSSDIASIRYVSHLMKPIYTYNYEITYTYQSRFYGEQSYTQTGVAEEGDYTGIKTGAILNTDFIINKTPYEKNFRQEINWNYTSSQVGEKGLPMENNTATADAVKSNTYNMTAHVYSSNTVNDKVTAEFILPYNNRGKDYNYSIYQADLYNEEDDAHVEGDGALSYENRPKDNLYDPSHESVKLETQAYSLFTADDSTHTGGDDIQASSLRLIEAPEYLITDDTTGEKPLQYHYKLYDDVRYYTGNSFKVGDVTYYLYAEDMPENYDSNLHKLITDAAGYTVQFKKVKYLNTTPDKYTTYHYAVVDDSGVTGVEGDDPKYGHYDYKIYFFSYVRDDETGAYLDNEGNSTVTPIFNGQYCVYSVKREIDGIVKNTGVPKYFTRWDITNTRGEYVASCYNRRFNFSGFDNYIVRPIYESTEANHYASSTDTETTAAITYLGDTRNQWNSDKGNYDTYVYGAGTDQDHPSGDKLIHDFALAFSYNGEEIRKVKNKANGGADIKIGMVIEQLAALDSTGGTKISDASYYADKYKGTVTKAYINNIATALAAGGSNAQLKTATGNDHVCVNSKIGANVSGWGALFGGTNPSSTTQMGFDSVINNFNRLQWYYTFTNTKTGEGGTIGATNNANFVYRAWAYIIVDGTATVSDTPTYFTLYDSASR